MIPVIEQNRQKIIELCKLYQVQSLHVFGSAVRNDYDENSDIDFIITYNKSEDGMPPPAFDYFDFWFNLEKIVGKKTDIIVSHSIRNIYFQTQVDKEKILLYAA